MADTELNFWRIFNSLLRHDSSAEESERGRSALMWATDNIPQIRAVCFPDERELIGLVWKYWLDHKSAPTLSILKDIIAQTDQSVTLKEALQDYQEQKPSLTVFDAGSLNQVLKEKTEAYQLNKWVVYLNNALQIANGSKQDPKTKKKLSGAHDSFNYLMGKVQDGILVQGKSSVGGNFALTGDELRDDYYAYKKAQAAGTLHIKTLIDKFDSSFGGMRAGQLWGILGFAGNRKSALARTLAYNSVLQGFNTLHIPLEQSYEEERNIYAIIHSHHPKFGEKFKLSKKALENGLLTLAEEDFLFSEVMPDLDTLPGTLIIKQPADSSWETIKAVAEIENQSLDGNLHELVIDYLTYMDTSHIKGGDVKTYMNGVIKDSKAFARDFNNKKGLVLISPVQGNRDGYDRAADNEGRWDKSGIAEFNEFERSLDGCLYTFIDENLQSLEQIKMGTCKVRREADVPVFNASISGFSGKVDNLRLKSKSEEKSLSDCIDDLMVC
jgi:hypothetical protein